MANDLFHFQLGGLQCAVIADVNEPLTEAYVSGTFAKDTERMLKGDGDTVSDEIMHS